MARKIPHRELRNNSSAVLRTTDFDARLYGAALPDWRGFG